MNRRHVAVPIVLTLAGVALLAGCIYIPTFGKLHRGVDATKQVGDANSRKPLRVGTATRADVERVLGPPRYLSPDGNEVAYTWTVLNGVWLSVCFGSDEITAQRAAVLSFEGDTLRGFRVEKNMAWLQRWRGATAPPMSAPAARPPTPPTAPVAPTPPSRENTVPSPPPGPRYDTPPGSP